MSLRTESPWPAVGTNMRWLHFLRHLPNFVRLYWRLFRDSRVSIWPKALLVVSLLYLVSPVDFIPDILLLLGRVDDLVLLIIACRVFLYMCPREVVQEHVHRIATGN